MKLRLPHRFQAALMAALASVSFTTLSTGTLGVATGVALLAGQQAQAQVTGIHPMQEVVVAGETYTTTTENGILVAEGDKADGSPISVPGYTTAEYLVLTSTNGAATNLGRYKVNATANLQNFGTVVLAAGSYQGEGGAVNFNGGQIFVNGGVTLTNDFIIGTSGYVESGYDGAFRLSDNVTFAGSLTLVQDAKMTVDGSSTVQGVVSGEGKTLTLGRSGSLTFNNQTTLGGLAMGSASATFNGAAAAKGNIGTVTSNANSTLTLINTDATISGNQSFKGNLFIGSGSTVTVAQTDSLDYNSTNTIRVAAGGTLDFGDKRWTLTSKNTVVLDGGTITGTGDGTDVTKGSLYFHQGGGMLRATSTSTVNAPVRLFTGGAVTTFDVVKDAELAINGIIYGAGNLAKAGAGTLTLKKNATHTGGTSLQGGTLKIATGATLSEGVFTMANGATFVNDGTATIGKVGSASSLGGTLTNTGTLNLAGDITVNTDVATSFEVATTGEKTYVGGGTSGYLSSDTTTYYLVHTTGGTVTNSANISGVSNLTFDKGTGNITFTRNATSSGIYYVNDNLTYNAETMGAATGFAIAAGATLTSDGSSYSPGKALHGAGTYALASGTTTLNGGLTLGTDWAGTVVITNAGNNTTINEENLVNGTLSTLQLEGFNGWFGNNHWYGERNQNIKLVDYVNASGSTVSAWKNAAASSTGTYTETFTGIWSGTGTFERAGGNRMDYKYLGDISQWTGKFQMTGGTTQLTFAGAAHEVNAQVARTGGTLNVVADTDVDFKAALTGINDFTVNAGNTVTFASAPGITNLKGAGTIALDPAKINSLGSNRSNWTGTVVLTGTKTDLNFGNLTNGSQSTLELKGYTGYSNAWNGTNVQNIKLTTPDGGGVAWNATGAATQKDNNTATYSGTWSGDGTMTIAPNKLNYTFTGDISQWTGKLQTVSTYSNTFNLTFTGNAQAINAEIAGQHNTNKMNLVVDTNATFSKQVTADTLTVNPGWSATLQGDGTLGALAGAGSLVVNGGTVTVGGNGGHTGTTTVSGGTLVASSGNALGSGAVNVTGGALDLTTSVSAGALTMSSGSIKFADSVTYSSSGDISLTGGILDLTGITLSQGTNTLATSTTGNINYTGVDFTLAGGYDKSQYILGTTGNALTLTFNDTPVPPQESFAQKYGTTLGTVQFVGDSITHGSDLGGTHNGASYRWPMHKIWTDTGVAYDENGYHVGNHSGGNYVPVFPGGSTYGGEDWDNRHSAQASGRAYELINGASRYSGNTPAKLVADYPSDVFFLMIGTNDTLSDYSAGGKGGVGAGDNPKTIYRDLMGYNVDDGTFSGNSRMDTIVDTFAANGGKASSVVVLSIPTWSPNHSNENLPQDFATMKRYNEILQEWCKQQGDNVYFVDVNPGIIDVANTTKPFSGVPSMFNDNLHPSGQGDLIFAANIARQLGYAGRSVGLARSASTGTGWTSAPSTPITVEVGTPQTFATGVFTTTMGYTVDFGAVYGDGETNGWDGAWNTSNINGLRVQVGDGTHTGTLTFSEAYVKWGDTVLYSRDNHVAGENFRIAYVNASVKGSDNVAAGYYVWMGDMLIGEALDAGTDSFNGIRLTSTGAAGSVTNLSWSDSAYAPTTTRYENQANAFHLVQVNPNPVHDNPVKQGEDNTIVWESTNSLFTLPQGQSSAADILYKELSSTIGANYTGAARSNYKGNIGMKYTGTENLQANQSVFGVQESTVTGSVYMQFDNANTVYKSFTNNNPSSVVASYNGNITGSYTAVYNAGIFEAAVRGGTYTNNSIGDGAHSYINGGTFKAGVYGGGVNGTITGGVTVTVTGGSITGSVYGGGVGGTINGGTLVTITGGIITGDVNGGGTGGTINGGTAVVIEGNLPSIGGNITADNVTLKNVEPNTDGYNDGFDWYSGTITGTEKITLYAYKVADMRASLVTETLEAKSGTNTIIHNLHLTACEVTVEGGSSVTLADTLTLGNTATYSGALSLQDNLVIGMDNLGSSSTSGAQAATSGYRSATLDVMKLAEGASSPLLSVHADTLQGAGALKGFTFSYNDQTGTLSAEGSDHTTYYLEQAGDSVNLTTEQDLHPELQHVVLNAANGTVVVTGTNTLTTASLAQNSTLTFDVDGSLTVSGAVSGTSANVVKDGSGTLTLNADNSALTGSFTIDEGTVKMGNVKSLGAWDNNRTILVNAGGTLDYNGLNAVETGYTVTLHGGTLTNTGADQGSGKRQVVTDLVLTDDSYVVAAKQMGIIANTRNATTIDMGGKTLEKMGDATFYLTNTTTSNGGTIKVSQGSVDFNVGVTDNAKLGSLNSNLELAGGNVGGNKINLGTDITVTGTGDGGTVSAVIQGAYGITKDGAGTVTLSGANTYTGGTTVSAGTLVTSNASALGLNWVNIADHATLRVTGNLTIGGNKANNYDGKLDNSQGGTLSLADGASLTLNAGSAKRSYNLGNVEVDGSASIRGYWFDATTSIANIHGDKNATLTLISDHCSSTGTWNIGTTGETAEKFTGTLVLQDQDTGGYNNRTANFNFNDGNMLSGATIETQTGLLTPPGPGAKPMTMTNNIILGASEVKFGGINDGTDDSSATSRTVVWNIAKSGSAAATLNLDGNGTYRTTAAVRSGVSIHKTGSGTQTLAGNNANMDGTVIIDDGTLVAGSANALGTGAIMVNDGGTLELTDLVSTVSGNMNINQGGTLKLAKYGDSTAFFANNLTLASKSILDLSALDIDGMESGPITLVQGGTIDGTNLDSVQIVFADDVTSPDYRLSLNGSNLVLTFTQPEPGRDLIWDGTTSNSWTGDYNWHVDVQDAGSAQFQDGDNVAFTTATPSVTTVLGDDANAGTMEIDNGVAVTVDTNGNNLTVHDLDVEEGGSLTKTGAGRATFGGSDPEGVTLSNLSILDGSAEFSEHVTVDGNHVNVAYATQGAKTGVSAVFKHGLDYTGSDSSGYAMLIGYENSVVLGGVSDLGNNKTVGIARDATLELKDGATASVGRVYNSSIANNNGTLKLGEGSTFSITNANASSSLTNIVNNGGTLNVAGNLTVFDAVSGEGGNIVYNGTTGKKMQLNGGGTVGGVTVNGGEFITTGTADISLTSLNVQGGTAHIGNSGEVILGNVNLDGGALVLNTDATATSLTTSASSTLTFAGADMLTTTGGITLASGTTFDLSNISYRTDVESQEITLATASGITLAEGENVYNFSNPKTGDARFALKNDNNVLKLVVTQELTDWPAGSHVRYTYTPEGGTKEVLYYTGAQDQDYNFSQADDGVVEFNPGLFTDENNHTYTDNTAREIALHADTTFVVEEGNTVHLGALVIGNNEDDDQDQPDGHSGTFTKDGGGTLEMALNSGVFEKGKDDINHYEGDVIVKEGTLRVLANSATEGESSEKPSHLAGRKGASVVVYKDAELIMDPKTGIMMPSGNEGVSAENLSYNIEALDTAPMTITNMVIDASGIRPQDEQDGARAKIDNAETLSITDLRAQQEAMSVTAADITVVSELALEGNFTIDNSRIHASGASSVNIYNASLGCQTKLRNNSTLYFDDGYAMVFSSDVDKTSRINADRESCDGALYGNNEIEVGSQENGGVATRDVVSTELTKTIAYTTDQYSGMSLVGYESLPLSLGVTLSDMDLPEDLTGYTFTLTFTDLDSSALLGSTFEPVSENLNVSLILSQFTGGQWEEQLASVQAKYDGVDTVFMFVTPEPTTSTLSLLALAALAARRRRK